MKKELIKIYEYFSHNFRTCTSTIVATLEALKMDLINVNDEEMNSVYESAYIMDILDISLNICIDHLIQKEVKNTDYELNVTNLIKKFLDEQKSFILLNEVETNVSGDDLVIYKNGYILKYLLQLIIFEAIKNSSDFLNIRVSDKEVHIKINNPKDNPPVIFNLLADIFHKYGFKFTFNDKEYTLEF
ncbi:hypothetical protein [Calditerrivibrio sp.]|uniref:hypothetical protein n=1 Tax=Calditerrivibrio sp. TaxID=2792612 RepID=UPI003D0F6B76